MKYAIVIRPVLHIVVLTVLPMTVHAHVHGVDERAPRTMVESPSTVRFAAKKPNVIDGMQIETLLLARSVPEDVLLIKCSLHQVAMCRGVNVALYDSDGNKVIVGNSGGSGIIGIEGLSLHIDYQIKIEHNRYTGEASGAPGRLLIINGMSLQDQ